MSADQPHYLGEADSSGRPGRPKRKAQAGASVALDAASNMSLEARERPAARPSRAMDDTERS
jgi:hypothetical protein